MSLESYINRLSSDNNRDLEVATGSASIAGVKSINEDAAATFVPTANHALINKGVCAIIADGVSSAEAGREASEYSAKNFIEEYYRTPDTWSVEQAGQKTLSRINLHLFKKSLVVQGQGCGDHLPPIDLAGPGLFKEHGHGIGLGVDQGDQVTG